MKLLKLSSLLFLATATLAHSDNYIGKVYSLEDPKTPLFFFSRSYTQEGENTLGIGEYKDSTQKLAVREETLLKGSTVITHSVQQGQLNEVGKIVIEKKKILFSYTREGKEKTSDESLGKNLVVSASLVPFIQDHWKKLIKGDTIEIRYASIDRSETIGFDLFKSDDDRAVAGNVVIKMKPSSFFVAAIVNPLFLHFDPKTKNLTEIYGRTAPKLLVGKDWKDLDAHTIYEVTK